MRHINSYFKTKTTYFNHNHVHIACKQEGLHVLNFRAELQITHPFILNLGYSVNFKLSSQLAGNWAH